MVYVPYHKLLILLDKYVRNISSCLIMEFQRFFYFKDNVIAVVLAAPRYLQRS
jgi:hypothetical protein